MFEQSFNWNAEGWIKWILPDIYIAVFFAKLEKLLTIFAKGSMVDVLAGSKIRPWNEFLVGWKFLNQKYNETFANRNVGVELPFKKLRIKPLMHNVKWPNIF